MATLYGEVRVRDKATVSAKATDQQYAPLIASSEARRLILVAPDVTSGETVGLAPPDGRGESTASLEERLLAYS